MLNVYQIFWIMVVECELICIYIHYNSCVHRFYCLLIYMLFIVQIFKLQVMQMGKTIFKMWKPIHPIITHYNPIYMKLFFFLCCDSYFFFDSMVNGTETRNVPMIPLNISSSLQAFEEHPGPSEQEAVC